MGYWTEGKRIIPAACSTRNATGKSSNHLTGQLVAATTMNHRYVIHVFLALFTSVLVGCAAPSVSFSTNDRQALTKVRVEPEVRMIQSVIQLQGNPIARNLANGGGWVAASAAEIAAKAPITNVSEFSRANGFSWESILKAEFISQANARGVIHFSEDEPSPHGYLTFTVNLIAFHQAHGLGSKMYPGTNITATLRRPDGSIAWQDTEFISALNPENTPGYEYEEYVANPEYVRSAMVRIAGLVSRLLVNDLLGRN